MEYAFDKNNNIVYAKDLDCSSSRIRFKCPNPDCNGDVMLRNSNSNYRVSCFYFRSNIRDKFGILLTNHIDNCYALTSSKCSNYDIEDFDFNEFIININAKGKNSPTCSPPSPSQSPIKVDEIYTPKVKTLKQLYNFCSSSMPYTQIGNTLVKDLFVGEKTLLYYKSKQKYISSPMLFHLKRIYKSENFSKFEFDAKCSTSNKLFLKFKIKFDNEALFKKMLNSFFYNKSNVKLKKAKFDFLVLATPGNLIPIENSKFYIQELVITSLSNVHIL